LPDYAAKESMTLLENDKTIVIDASTAHRTVDGWDYGLPELSAAHRKAIEKSKRISNPGCFPTGFNLLMHPLVHGGIVPKDCLVTCNSVTGYSGGGRSLIEKYEDPANKEHLVSPNLYALTLSHKHLPEMQKHSGLNNKPLFSPAVCGYHRGMTVSVPLFAKSLAKKTDADEIRDLLAQYYTGQRFVKVMPKGYEDREDAAYYYRGINPVACNNTNDVELFAFGNDEQILLVARFDNLGKGASGAAVQNMNIVLGFDEAAGL